MTGRMMMEKIKNDLDGTNNSIIKPPHTMCEGVLL